MRHVNTSGEKKNHAIKTQSVFSLGRVKSSTAVFQDQDLGFVADKK